MFNPAGLAGQLSRVTLQNSTIFEHTLDGALYAPLSRVDWATLLRRTFDVDVTRRTGCAGRMTVRAVVTDPASIDRLLAALRRARDPLIAA